MATKTIHTERLPDCNAANIVFCLIREGIPTLMTG